MVIERGRNAAVSPMCGGRRFLFAELRQRFFARTGSKLSARFMFRLLKVVVIAIIGLYSISVSFNTWDFI